MSIPGIFLPTSVEEILLPSNQLVQIPKATPQFTAWSGEPVRNDYGGKAVLDFKGTPAFAELVILKYFQEVEWQGVWVDTFSSKYCTEYWPKNEVILPPQQQVLLRNIYQSAGSTKGCWDVCCWKDNVTVFAESKRKSKDKIRETQRHWLQAALLNGLPVTAFLVVEWSI